MTPIYHERFIVLGIVIWAFFVFGPVLFTGIVIAQTGIQEAEKASSEAAPDRELLLIMEIPTVITAAKREQPIIESPSTISVITAEQISVFAQELEREEMLFAEIVITAAKHEQPVSDAPSFVTVITADDIQKYGYNTLADALRGVAGMFVTNDRNYENLGVRGFFRTGDYTTRVLVLVNGHTTNDNVYAAGFIGPDFGIDMDIVEKIEIVRGPGSALYGTNAIFAVINVITKTGENLNGLRVSLKGGTYKKREGNFSFGDRYDNGLELLVSGSLTDTKGDTLYFDEFKDEPTEGYVDNDYDKYYSLLSSISFADFSLFANINSREKGIPTAPYETIFADDRTSTTDGRSYVELKYARQIDRTKNFMGRGYYDGYNYEGVWPWLDEEFEYVFKETSDGRWWGSELQFTWEQYQRNQVMLGGEFQRHFKVEIPAWDEDEDGNVIYEYPTISRSYNFWSLYLQDEFNVTEDLAFTLGVHHDQYPTFGGATNPRVALVYKPFKKSVVKLLYGEGFKAPNTYELYYTDEDVQIGNEDLEPEKVKTYEAGLEQSIGTNLWGRISIYHSDVEELITQVDMDPEPVSELLQYQNVGDAAINGLELELKGALKNGSKGYLNFAYQDSKDKETKEELINVPRLAGNLGVSIPIIRDKVYASLEGHYLGKRLTKEEGIAVDPYFIANLTLLSKNLLRNLEISASIYNLFDEEYEDAAGEEHLQVKIPQNGRNFLIKMGYLF